jgi:hypothetical protein
VRQAKIKYQFVTVSALIVAVTLSSKLFGAELELYRWPAIKGAAYYEGTATSGGQSYRFQTGGTKLLLEAGIEVKLVGFNRYGQPLNAKILPEHSAISQLPLPIPTAAVDSPPPSPTVPAEPSPVEDAENSSSSESTTEFQPTPEEVEKLAELDEEKKSAFSDASYRSLAIYLGFGRESISASGGSSVFEGAAGVGGSAIEFGVYLKEATGSPISLYLIGQGHNFTTDQSKSGESTDTEEKLTTSHQFIDIDAYAGYVVFQTHPASIEAYLGLSSIAFPMMKIKNIENGQSELAVASATGLTLGVGASWVLPDYGAIKTTLLYLPVDFSDEIKAQSLQMQMFWRFSVVENLFTHVGIGLHQKASYYDQNCPVDKLECSTSGTGKSAKVTLQLGVGVKF